MTAAAKSLDTNTATVSRHIHRMTEIYSTVLFVKKRTRWELTKEGEALVRVIETFEKGLHDLDRNNGLELTSGRTVKITTVEFLCSAYLMPGLGRFSETNPGLSLEFVCSDENINLAQGEADVSVRMSRPQEGRLVGRKAAEISIAPYRIKGSTQRGWIGLGEELDWTPEMRGGRSVFGEAPQVRVQSFDAARRGALATGLGCMVPMQMAALDERLERVAIEHAPVSRDIWVVYHETRKMDPVVRLTADWVHTCFQNRASKSRLSVA